MKLAYCRTGRPWLMAAAVLLVLTGCGGGGSGTASGVFDQPPRAPRIPIARKVFGLNFGPYVLAGQDPNTGVTIPVNQLNYLVKTAALYTTWIRTFGTTNGLERAGQAAHASGLKAALGAFIGTDTRVNETQITNLIQAAQRGEVDLAIVGNEVLLAAEQGGGTMHGEGQSRR